MPRLTKKPGKSFIDEFECSVADYKGLLKRYLQYNLDSALPLSTTQNLYFHQVSAHHKRAGIEAGSIPDLFDYTRIPADGPAWDPLYYLIREDVDQVLEDYSGTHSRSTSILDRARADSEDRQQHARHDRAGGFRGGPAR